MKVRSKLIASIAVALVAVAGIAGPASASVEGAEAEFLEQLESIGVQARYQQVDDSGENGGLQAKGAVFSPYACDLNPSRTHKRASGNYGTVGAKPYTKCTKGTPTSIKMETRLYMVEWGGLSYRQVASYSGGNRNERSYTIKHLAYQCRNSNKSTFQQITKGTTVEAGKTYRATVQTQKDAWTCGS